MNRKSSNFVFFSQRVTAKNAADSLSDYSAESFLITCREEVIPPRIEFDSKYRDTVVVKAGEKVKLEANISGMQKKKLFSFEQSVEISMLSDSI